MNKISREAGRTHKFRTIHPSGPDRIRLCWALVSGHLGQSGMVQ
jgi:hypothetical protein